MGKHTSLPWSISHGYDLSNLDGFASSYVCGPDPNSIGIKIATPWIEGAWDDDAEAKANAEFIVTACNAHYDNLARITQLEVERAELVEALGRLVDACNLRALRGRDHVPSMRVEQDARRKGHATLTRITGEAP